MLFRSQLAKVQHSVTTTNLAMLLTTKSPHETSLECNLCYSAPDNLYSPPSLQSEGNGSEVDLIVTKYTQTIVLSSDP